MPEPPDRYASIVQAWALLRRLQTGTTLEEAAAALGVSVRTIYRLREALQAAGVVLTSAPDPGTRALRWRLVDLGLAGRRTRRGSARGG